MKLHLDTQFVDLVLEQWAKGEHDYSKVYELPIFQAFWKRQEFYLHRSLTKEECLHDLLFIDDIDMESHKAEIIRNIEYIKEIDLNALKCHVERYLPEFCLDVDMEIPVCLMIGIAGMAFGEAIIMDPSPCPWFVNDGSDKEKYLKEHFIPTLEHELHHVGYERIRTVTRTRESKTLRELVTNLLCDFQMEGGAQLCEIGWDESGITADEQKEWNESWQKIRTILEAWLQRGEQVPSEEDWELLTKGWRGGLFYRSTMLMCKALVSAGYYNGVGDCMLDEPLALYEKANELSMTIATP